MNIYILHLYYDIMNLYEDYGNVLIIKKHLIDQGYNVIIDKKTISDEINFSKYQFIYVGGGTERNFFKALKDIKRYKNQIDYAIENKGVFLLTGNSFEMLGNRVGREDGLNIFDFESIRTNSIKSSDIIYSFVSERII